ncbi:MAG: cation:proton antiporter [Lachnospiraceae bacterium]|jgi:Kef-type K+ transport system membrane component KefB
MTWMELAGWAITLAAAFLIGKLVSLCKLPSILGWLIAGMIFGPYGLGLLSQNLMDTAFYNVIINWMQVAFGIMLGAELIWRRIRSYGRALVVTTLTQSLGTFLVVSAVFGVLFHFTGIPVWLGFVFGSIALATAPAPALSIVQEFHTKGPVTDTLLPMTVMDDVVGIAVFFTVNALASKIVTGGASSWAVIPLMIFLPIGIGIVPGWLTGRLLRRVKGRKAVLTVLLAGVTATQLLCWLVYTWPAAGLMPNYMLAGVAFSTVFSNMIDDEQLQKLTDWYSPVLGIALVISIVNLGAPLDYHLIIGAGVYTAVYILSRAAGKYFGARFGASITHMPETVRKYLGLTLLPHSGVSLVFTGIICQTLASAPQLAQIVQGTIAAAAVINEIIAVIAAREGFRMAGEISRNGRKAEANG